MEDAYEAFIVDCVTCYLDYDERKIKQEVIL